MTSSNREQERINQQAREWFVSQQSGDVSAEQQQSFERWLQEPSHRQAYAEYEAIWEDLGALRATPMGQSLAQSLAQYLRPLRRWQYAAGALAAGLMLFTVGLIFRTEAPQWQDYQTARGETRQLELVDGSTVTLGAYSKLRYRQDDDGRYAQLLRGEAFFDVARDPALPFAVATGTLRVAVVGTRFDVRVGELADRIWVEEGKVAVQGPSNTGAQLQLTAGELAVSLPGMRVEKRSPDELQVAADWRRGRLSYRSAQLAEVLSDLNRYSDRQWTLASPALSGLRVTLAINLSQLSGLPELLAASLPVEVREGEDNTLLIFPKS